MKKFSILLIALLPSLALAHGPHNEYVTNVTNITNPYSADGVALAMAMAAPQYDLNVKSAQIGVGGGWYRDQNGNGSSGIAVGLGKRFCLSKESCGIMNFSAGMNEGGGVGLNFGFTWKL